jgi:branched-chain amino acid transport system permease protein
MGSIYALLGVGPTLLYRVFGIYNFAHGAFVCLGAYLFFFAFSSDSTLLPPSFTEACTRIFIGSFIGAVVLVRLGIRPFLRAAPLACLVSTLAWASIFEALIVMVWGIQVRIVDPSFEGLEIGVVFVTREQMLSIIVAPLICLLFGWLFSRTRFSRQVWSVADFREGAEMLGVVPERILFFTVWLSVLSGCIAGIFLSYEGGLDPTLGVAFSFKSFIVMVLAGRKNLIRILPAGFFLAFLESITVYMTSLSGVRSTYRDMLVYAFLIILLYRQGMPRTDRQV